MEYVKNQERIMMVHRSTNRPKAHIEREREAHRERTNKKGKERRAGQARDKLNLLFRSVVLADTPYVTHLLIFVFVLLVDSSVRCLLGRESLDVFCRATTVVASVFSINGLPDSNEEWRMQHEE